LLAPRQIRRDEPVDIGVDGEVAGRVDAGGERQYCCKRHNRPRMARADTDYEGKLGFQHRLFLPAHICRPAHPTERSFSSTPLPSTSIR
jgi:hypothetical protein